MSQSENYTFYKKTVLIAAIREHILIFNKIFPVDNQNLLNSKKKKIG